MRRYGLILPSHPSNNICYSDFSMVLVKYRQNVANKLFICHYLTVYILANLQQTDGTNSCVLLNAFMYPKEVEASSVEVQNLYMQYCYSEFWSSWKCWLCGMSSQVWLVFHS